MVVAGGSTFRISYLGGTGNDIVLKAGPAVAAVAIAVDPASAAGSDGNGVFEPGETVTVKPSWKNVGTLGVVVFNTAASNFTGPAGPSYSIVDGTASYGTIGAGATADCGADALSLFVRPDPASRPTTHWDATFTETPATSDPPKVWTLHLGDSFTVQVRVDDLLPANVELVHGPGCPVCVTRWAAWTTASRSRGSPASSSPSSATCCGLPARTGRCWTPRRPVRHPGRLLAARRGGPRPKEP